MLLGRQFLWIRANIIAEYYASLDLMHNNDNKDGHSIWRWMGPSNNNHLWYRLMLEALEMRFLSIAHNNKNIID